MEWTSGMGCFCYGIFYKEACIERGEGRPKEDE